MRKLKACPYCGGEAQIEWPPSTEWMFGKGAYISIRCEQCMARSGSVQVLSGDKQSVKFGLKELDDTIAVWNRDKSG